MKIRIEVGSNDKIIFEKDTEDGTIARIHAINGEKFPSSIDLKELKNAVIGIYNI
jgi:hypothetical protein